MVNFYKAKKQQALIGQSAVVTIDRLDLNGAGVARYQNKPLFVDGALVGEQVKVKISEQKSKYLRANLLAVNKASEHRVTPQCQHFAECGGCDLQHLDADQHLQFKQEKVANLFARSQVKQQLPWQGAVKVNSWHYRRKARIGIQYAKSGQAIIGFRAKQSNRVLNINACPVLLPELSELFKQLKTLIGELSTDKSIGHIEVIATEQKVLVVRQLKPMNSADKALWQVFSTEHDYAILIDDGKAITPLTRPVSLRYLLSDNSEIAFASDDFIQVNQAANDHMVNQALDWLELAPNDTVLDLFCGLGNFSLPIARQVSQVVGVEGVSAMVDKAKANAERNQLNNCQFYQANLHEPWLKKAWAQQNYNKVLLDPARAGALPTVEQVAKLKPERIVYVSCDPATLARDSHALINLGYQMKKIGLVEMFSQTKHVETMVLFLPSS